MVVIRDAKSFVLVSLVALTAGAAAARSIDIDFYAGMSTITR